MSLPIHPAAIDEYVRCFAETYDVLEAWRSYTDRVEGMALPSDHYVPEEAPQETAAALREFFTG